jgi:hypothetical protein
MQRLPTCHPVNAHLGGISIVWAEAGMASVGRVTRAVQAVCERSEPRCPNNLPAPACPAQKHKSPLTSSSAAGPASLPQPFFRRRPLIRTFGNDRPRGERAGVRLAALLPVAQAVARGRKPRTGAKRYKVVAHLVSSSPRPRAVLAPCMLLIGRGMRLRDCEPVPLSQANLWGVNMGFLYEPVPLFCAQSHPQSAVPHTDGRPGFEAGQDSVKMVYCAA